MSREPLNSVVPDSIYQPLCGTWGCVWSLVTETDEGPTFRHDQQGVISQRVIPHAMLDDASVDIWGVLLAPWIRELHSKESPS